jgi:signal peptide peptidase SppA
MIPAATILAPQFGRIGDWFGAWAIEETAGSQLLSMVQKTDLFAHVAQAVERKAASDYSIVKSGKENVAVIMLTGPLMKSVGSMSAGTSTVEARRAIRKAAADPDVTAILLAIDSPGGSVSGTADLGADIKAASKHKQVWAHIDDLGASAAYWCASQCEKIFANNDTALVGSIGTLAVVYDLSAAAEKEGVKVLVFGTGPLKGSATPGSVVTEEQQAYFRGIVDDAQQSFDKAVQKGRGLTDRQLEAVKTGGVFGAREALTRNLIDGIQSFDATIAQLAAEARRNSRSTVRAESPVTRSLTVNENDLPAVDTKAIAEATTKAVREAAAAEQSRIAAINAECVGCPDIAAKAIAEGWTAEKAENAALKAKLASGVKAVAPGQINHGSSPTMPNGVGMETVLEAGLLMSLGAKNLEKQFKPDALEVAHSRYRGMGLQQAILTAAVMNGYPGQIGERITSGNLAQIVQYSKGQRGPKWSSAHGDRQATSSTISMAGILGATAYKELVAGYEEVDDTCMQIAAVKSVSNFQQVTTYRMLDDMAYEELGPDGKIKHGTTGQESYTRQVKTYAKMFAITRTNIINDDLGAFADVRARLGRGMAMRRNVVFWTAFVNNSSFFTSARTNLISGGTTNLGTDGVGIGLGVKAFRKMKSPAGTAPLSADGGKHINQGNGAAGMGGKPEILLVPPELEGNAEVIYRNQNLGSVKNSDANIYQNKYRPVVAWQLSDTSYTGYSATAWYLLNNPAYLPTIVISYLNGQQTPTVEEADGDFDELCYQYRGYGDFGCDMAEYLGGLRSDGA